MFKSIRRVITGVQNQYSKLLTDDTVETIQPYDMYSSFQLQNLFYTENNPQSLTTSHLNTPYNIDLPEGAFRFIKLRMPTKVEMIADLKKGGHVLPTDWKKFNLHQTNSVDYIYVLSGKITYVVGDKLIELQEGDFIAQLGPEHTWINDHDEPCFMLCVMIGIKPNENVKRMQIE